MLPTGLTADGLYILQSALRYGVQIAGVNVMAIAQGSSELNISFVVADGERDKAVRAVHEEFHRS